MTKIGQTYDVELTESNWGTLNGQYVVYKKCKVKGENGYVLLKLPTVVAIVKEKDLDKGKDSNNKFKFTLCK